MEKGLEAELDDELGYSKYDCKNKDTDNSRCGPDLGMCQFPGIGRRNLNPRG